MSDNLVLDFIEKEGYKDKITDADNKLIEANIELADENRLLKEELKRVYKRIDEAKEEIRKRSTEEVAELYINILEGE